MAKDPEKTNLKSLAVIKKMGFEPKKICANLSVPELVEFSVIRKEANMSSTGALSVFTGKFTGRSPDDRYIVLQACRSVIPVLRCPAPPLQCYVCVKDQVFLLLVFGQAGCIGSSRLRWMTG